MLSANEDVGHRTLASLLAQVGLDVGTVVHLVELIDLDGLALRKGEALEEGLCLLAVYGDGKSGGVDEKKGKMVRCVDS